MKGYIVTNEDGTKEIYSNMPRRIQGGSVGMWMYNHKNSNDMQDCMYLREWEEVNLPEDIENQTWNDEPIEVEINIKIK